MNKNDPRTIHETVLRDVISILSDLKDHDEIEMMMNRDRNYTSSSIAKLSSNLILEFPVLCSSSISFKTAAMVSKAIERKCCVMLQMIFAAYSLYKGDGAADFIHKFHTNMKYSGSIDNKEIDDIVNKIDNMIEQMDLNQENLRINIKEAYNLIIQDMKRNLNYYLTQDISDYSLNEIFQVKNIYGNNVITEAPIYDKNDLSASSLAALRITKDFAQSLKNMNDVINTDKQIKSQQLFPTDIKKANEIVPSMMIVTVNREVEDGNYIPENFVIGVKAKLILVDAYDIVDRIASKNKDNNWIIKLIRATTREISFVRDFLFAIDKAKADVLAQSSKGSSSPIWKLLERRALKSKVRRSLSQVNDATMITTLVMSNEEVDYLQKNYGIHMENPSIARNIMDSYNLMGIVLVDESTEVANLIWDTGDDIYETVTFDFLERESNDGAYKKVVNLVSKFNR